MQRAYAHLSIVILLATAWVLAVNLHFLAGYLIDDAYITFVYARNLAEGFGLRYNALDAAPTEGFSSLLQVGVAAAFEAGGLDPLAATRASSLALFIALPVAAAAVLRRTLDAPTSFVFLAFASAFAALAFLPETRRHVASGMDTVLFAAVGGFAFLWAAQSILGPPAAPPGIRTGLAGVVLLFLLTAARPEGIVLAGGYLLAVKAAVVFDASRGRPHPAAKTLRTAAVGTAIAVCAFALWKIGTFGDVLPNPYYVKSHNAIYGSHSGSLDGASEILRFLGSRVLPPIALLACLAPLAGGGTAWLWLAVLLLPSLAGVLAYTNVIHEMAFGHRYAYPHLIPAAIAVGWGVSRLWSSRPRVAGSIALCLAFGPLLVPSAARHFALASWKHPIDHATSWLSFDPATTGDPHVDLGLDLADSGLGTDGTLVLGSAGMIPYFSRFTAIDWVGLNDTHLSGRIPLSLAEVAAYIDAKHPDVFVSVLPPASPGETRRDADPAFASTAVRAVLNPNAPSLLGQWDRELVAKLTYDQMRTIRDDYAYAAHYALGRKLALIAYVNTESPHAARLLSVLRTSSRSSRSMALQAFYGNDPSRHRADFEANAAARAEPLPQSTP